MKIPNTDPALPRYYLGGLARTTNTTPRGFFKAFDLNPIPSNPLHGLGILDRDISVDNRFDAIRPRFDEFANRGDAMNGMGLMPGELSGEVGAGPNSPGDMPAVGNIFTSLIAAYNQQKLIDLNIQRAAQGLPPISSASIAPTVNVGLSPETMHAVLLGGAAILGFMLIRRAR